MWLRFLTEIKDQTTQVPAEILQDADIREAVEYLDESSYTPAEHDAYDRCWDQVSVERTYIGDAYREGYKQGLEIAEKMRA